MIRLTKLALKRPVTIILCLVTIVYFGFQSLMGARMELIPEMELPMLLISTVYAGASPDDVEELITSKQEDAVSTLSGIDTVQSYSMENVSVVMIQYEYGTNMDTAYINLKKAMDGIQSQMPEDAGDPNILEMDINAMPSIMLSVSGNVGTNLYTYVENQIVPELERLSAVGEVSLAGGQRDYVRVELMADKLEQYHLTMNQVAQLVGAADFTVPAGSVDEGDQSLDVSVANDYDSVESLENIPIPLADGNIIYLSDVANVYQATDDASSISRYNGEDIISISVTKQQRSTAIEVSQQVMNAIAELEQMNPALDFVVINDSSEMIESSIQDVFSTVILAVILSMIVLWLFCGDVKAALIIGISIVCSVVLALISMTAMGFSLNVISLTSLVFGVGMMVDNSINVLDGCFRAKETMNYYDAAIEGTKNMIGAIAGGTVTNCIVFVPLLLLQGLTGQLFTQLAWTIIFCLIASLFSAVTIVPLCFYMWHPQEHDNAPINGLLKGLQKWYRNHMPSMILKTRRVFGVTAILLVLALVMATQLDMELMPASDEGIVNVTINVRPGLKVDAINEIVTPVEELVSADENTDYYLLTYGSSGISVSSGDAVSLTVYLKDERTKSTDEVIDQWMEEAAYMENCTISMESGSSTSMMSAGRQIELDFQGTDYDVLREDVQSITEALRQREDVIQVHSSVENAAPIVRVTVDPVKAQAEGLTPASIGSTVYTNLSGVDAATIRVDNEDIDVTVEFAADRYNTIDKLQGMLLTTPTGASVPLEDLAEIYYEDSPQQIVRKDKVYQVNITMQPNIGFEDTAQAAVNEFVRGWEFQQGVSLAVNATDEQMMEELGALGSALITAVFLIFIAMAIQFESPKYSLMVMSTIVFSMIGAFGFLFLADSAISMVSMLGFLMMVGNVVNGGILYVETANQFRADMPLEKALVEAGAIRLRPILMTVAITVISELPNMMAFGEAGETMQGAGLVNVGGLVASTALMLLMMPTFYRVVTRLGKRFAENNNAVD